MAVFANGNAKIQKVVFGLLLVLVLPLLFISFPSMVGTYRDRAVALRSSVSESFFREPLMEAGSS